MNLDDAKQLATSLMAEHGPRGWRFRFDYQSGNSKENGRGHLGFGRVKNALIDLNADSSIKAGRDRPMRPDKITSSANQIYGAT